MDKRNSCHSMIELIHRNIQYYRQMIALSSNPDQRVSFENLLYSERMRLNYWRNYYFQLNNRENQLNQRAHPSLKALPDQRLFSIEELVQYDGSNGKPAYVAVNGIIYDVSIDATWGGGTHFSLYAGKSLTAQFTKCHGGRLDVLRNLPQVGNLEE